MMIQPFVSTTRTIALIGLCLAAVVGQAPPTPRPNEAPPEPSTPSLPPAAEIVSVDPAKPPFADEPAARERLLAAARAQRAAEDAPEVTAFEAEYSLTAFVDDRGQPTQGPRSATVRFAGRIGPTGIQVRREVEEGGVRTLYVRENEQRHWLATQESVRLLESAPELAKELARFRDEVRLIERWLGVIDLRRFAAEAQAVRLVQRAAEHRFDPTSVDPRRRRAAKVDELEAWIPAKGSEPALRLQLAVHAETSALLAARFVTTRGLDRADQVIALHLGESMREPTQGWTVWLHWLVFENHKLQIEGSQSSERRERLRINPELAPALFRKPQRLP